MNISFFYRCPLISFKRQILSYKMYVYCLELVPLGNPRNRDNQWITKPTIFQSRSSHGSRSWCSENWYCLIISELILWVCGCPYFRGYCKCWCCKCCVLVCDILFVNLNTITVVSGWHTCSCTWLHVCRLIISGICSDERGPETLVWRCPQQSTGMAEFGW